MTIYKTPNESSELTNRESYVVTKAAAPQYDIWKNGLYDGKDLRPFDGRPGALDFLKCPSKGLSK